MANPKFFEIHFIGETEEIDVVRDKLGSMAKFITFNSLVRLVIVGAQEECAFLNNIPHVARSVGDDRVYIFLTKPDLNANLSLGDAL